MNLLKDKRDLEKLDAPVFSAPPKESQRETEALSDNPEPEIIKKPKNTLGTLLLAAFVFILAIVVTYFGFYKNKQSDKIHDPDTSVTAMDSNQGDEKSLPDAGDSTDEGQDNTETPAMSVGEVSSLRIASEFMQNIQAATARDNVTTLFMDDGSFSAEIDASSLVDAKNIYAAVRESLPSHTQITSSAPVNGTVAIISGTFTPAAVPSGSGLTRGEIETKLREFAGQANNTISSLNISKQEDQHFVFMKTEGSFENCRTFVEKLADENIYVSVSKLIMTQNPSGSYTFVLRFYL